MHHNRTVHCRLQVVVQVILISLSENLLGKLKKLSLYHLFCTSHAAHEHIFHNFRNKQFHKQKMRKDGTLHKIILSKNNAYAKNTLSCSITHLKSYLTSIIAPSQCMQLILLFMQTCFPNSPIFSYMYGRTD